MTSPLPTRFTSVEIPTRDLAAAIAWYERALGLVAIWRDEHHAMLAFAGQSVGSVYLVSTEAPERLAFRSTHTGVAHSVVDFHTDDLHALHAHLAAIGAESDPLREGAFGFGFRDIDGNCLSACTL